MFRNNVVRQQTCNDVEAFEKIAEQAVPLVTKSQSFPYKRHEQLHKTNSDGNVDLEAIIGVSGMRPTVDQHSLHRYSISEWNRHNQLMLNTDSLVQADIIYYNAQNAMISAIDTVDKHQGDNNKRLKHRTFEIFRWKTQLKKTCDEISKEIELIELERQRLKQILEHFMLPKAISKECIELGSKRIGKDLVFDVMERQLIKESNMVSDVTGTLTTILANMKQQQLANRAAKDSISYDYCDKKIAYDVEAKNLALDTHSSVILFQQGATKFGEATALLPHWENNCREIIKNCEVTRIKSAELRRTFKEVLQASCVKLRLQADTTDVAFAEAVSLTQDVYSKLEMCLRSTLKRIANIETSIVELKHTIMKTDGAMKCAQTRLNNRNNQRPRGEMVLDKTQMGLIEEVRSIHYSVTDLQAQIKQAELIRTELMIKRASLEHELIAKCKCLQIIRDRCIMIRSHYPSALDLHNV